MPENFFARFANEIYEHITAQGGRLLCLVNTTKPMNSVVEDGEWKVLPVKAALEKIKQALRETK